ncbi:MAG: prepilin-type N-terminal cleavage/methylation domain-containing protein [Limnobacter sp.]|uniref:prepilin-type N-terminal cleavage/methylation domain-containing protein n=1 Tax=Limnobacter sp. TaxID=2003368 RepID=UPI00391A11C0
MNARGFTLLELLVVLVVLSIATGLVVVRGTPSDGNLLLSEAQRLSQILRIAQQDAILKSRDIRFHANDQGFRFEELANNTWRPLEGEPMLRPRNWNHTPVRVELQLEGRQVPFLTLEPQTRLELKQVRLVRNATGVMLESRNGGLYRTGQPQVLVVQGAR